jgi:hypothetical protein
MQAVGLGALEFDDGGLPGMAGPGQNRFSHVLKVKHEQANFNSIYVLSLVNLGLTAR